PTSLASTLFPLNENDEVRATTRSPSTFARASRISSLMPSQKYSWSFAWLRSTNGSTAMLFPPRSSGNVLTNSPWKNQIIAAPTRRQAAPVANNFGLRRDQRQIRVGGETGRAPIRRPSGQGDRSDARVRGV